MRNNHFIKTQILLAALAAAVIAPICAFSQQRTAARTTIKDSDIYVPEAVLEPSYTRKEASDMLKECIAKFGDTDMPRSYEVFAKNPDKYKRIGSRQLKSAMGMLYNFIFDPAAKPDSEGRQPVDTELIEVTGVRPEWFKSLYNKALELNEPAAMMDKAILQKDSALYTKATKAYAEKYEALQDFSKKSPDRLDAATRKRYEDANKAKRKADFIAQHNKVLQEQAAAAQQALQEALKDNSSKKK